MSTIIVLCFLLVIIIIIFLKKNNYSKSKFDEKEIKKEDKENTTTTYEKSNNIKIKDVYKDSKFSIFLNYCNENNMIYMSELENFDFFTLLNVKGLGMSKLNNIKELFNEYQIKKDITYENNSLINKEEIYTNNTKIVDIYTSNKFSIFLNYCNDNNIIYMSELENFDFFELSNVKGLGETKIKAIINLFNDYKENKNKCTIIENKEVTNQKEQLLFTNLPKELDDIDISLLQDLKINNSMIEILKQNQISTFNKLRNIPYTFLKTKINKINFDRLIELSDKITDDFNVFLDYCINLHLDDKIFDILVKRNNGATLLTIAEEQNLTRERIRQIISKFHFKIDVITDIIVQKLIKDKKYFKTSEIIDLIENEKTQDLLIMNFKNKKNIEYLECADVFVLKNNIDEDIYTKISKLAKEFIGDMIDLKKNEDEFYEFISTNNLEYLDEDSFINLAKELAYTINKKLIFKKELSYGYLCSKVIDEEFPNGIKLYESTDLDILRKYCLDVFGDLNLPNNNRAMSSRLEQYLVLAGRGLYITEEKIKIDMNLVLEIKDFIDSFKENEIYYSEIFVRFEDKLLQTTNIDNYHFLHGVLKLYFNDEYQFYKDYLVKDSNYSNTRKINIRIKKFIEDKGRFITKKEISEEFKGLNQTVYNSVFSSDDELLKLDINKFTLLKYLNITDEDKIFLKNILDRELNKNDGYCNEYILYDKILEENKAFIIEKDIQNSKNIYNIYNKLFKNDYDFYSIHILNKDILSEINTKTIIFKYLNIENTFSLSKLKELLMRFKLIKNEYSIIETISEDFYRISEDEFIKKEIFSIDNEIINEIEQNILNSMKDGYVLSTNLDLKQLPKFEYNINSYLIKTIVENFSHKLKIIDILFTNKINKYIICEKNRYNDFEDIIINHLKNNNIIEISEDSLFKIINEIIQTNKISKKFFNFKKLQYNNEIFKIIE